MPMYEYTCRSCGERFELLRAADERDQTSRCPHCGAEAEHPRAASLFAGVSKSGSDSSCAPGPAGGG